MKTIFKSLGLWESVVEGFTEPNTVDGMIENQKNKLDEKRQKDASAFSLIQRNVTDSIFPRIMRVESAKEAWETLRNEFHGDDKVRAIKLQSLRKDLENMKMKEDETLKDYSSRFLELINQMKTHGEDISDQRIVEKILISLPKKFDPIVAVIEETKDLSTLARAKKENDRTLINLRENQVEVEDMEEEKVEIEEEAEATLDNKVEKQGVPFDVLQENSTQEDENDEDSPPNTPRADSSSSSSSTSSTPRRMRSLSDPTLYVKHQAEKGILTVALYVDDLLFTGNSEKMIKDFRKEMMKKYEMNDMGLLKHFLGMEIHQDDEGVFICQKNYAEKVLKKFRMYDCNLKATPLIVGEKLKREDGGSKVDATFYRSMVRNLLYLTATRPDIMFAASLLSRFMQAPSHFHLGATKRVLRYIQGTIDYGIMNGRSKEVKRTGFCDSDFGGCKDDMKSTSGYCFTLGSGVFSWLSKKQQSVAQSSAEAEYVSAAIATSQAIWLRRIFHDFGQKQERKTELFCDNKSAIAMAKNPVFHSRTRHIALKYHFIREAIEEGEIELEFCKSKEQVADIFTKALPRERRSTLQGEKQDRTASNEKHE
ncbi:hypothetical protein RJ640_009519 [Escallonia rubra]|uniref:Reverse transcriptase Ty1/copia-type domain-containing protein n=1 Tax=Escallonia rubra TaxID=112253 RepID=A0AA88QU04_9ASTE|nr:hypothetical protein RJ640_009519 [Escallonia rubra]